jgi:hypothetical protein
MKILTRNDRRELRFFALGIAAFLVIVFWWWVPTLRGQPEPLWPLLVAWVLVMMAWAWPPSTRTLAWINTWLLLGFVFFAILLPLGWVLRTRGRLQYVTGFDRAAATYRVPVPADHRTNLDTPF